MRGLFSGLLVVSGLFLVVVAAAIMAVGLTRPLQSEIADDERRLNPPDAEVTARPSAVAVKGNSSSAEAAPKEAAPKEAAPKEAAPKEAAPKEAAPKMASSADSDRTTRDDAARAPKPPTPPEKRKTNKISGAMDSICMILESAAKANELPLEFFARVIWQESRFQPNAVGPLTRSGHRAQGIAQFMPYTAAERGLLDPFDPVAALPKAAEFLSELRGEFGNLGLAAAAYNAGPQRVRNYLTGRGGMPGETRHYVRTITGRSVDDWVALRHQGDKDAVAPPTSCRHLAALLKKQPNFFVSELERRVRAGTLRPWGVQLSAGFNRSRALASYARIQRRYRTILKDRDPMILGTLLRSRGTRRFYQVRVGTNTRAEANRLCANLKKKGGACMVLRTSRRSSATRRSN